MKPRIALFALGMLALLASEHARADEWTGPDKQGHLDAGIAVSTLARQHGFTKRDAFLIGAGVGLAKELGDATGGDPSAKDLAVTALGALAGAYAPGLRIVKTPRVLTVSYTWSF
jgi:hypothetical protein